MLYEAQRRHALATTGIYSYVRHPQYVGFILIMFGFLLQWPTLLTLAMFPVLVFMYVRLARIEERELLREFGDEYRAYMQVPAFIPRLGCAAARRRPRSRPSPQGHAGSGIPADDRRRTRSPGPGRYHA